MITSNISNMRRCVSSDIQTLRHLCVWISDETEFRVFDMASQMINNSWGNSRLKVAKLIFMVIRNTYPNHGHSSDFLCFPLIHCILLSLRNSVHIIVKLVPRPSSSGWEREWIFSETTHCT